MTVPQPMITRRVIEKREKLGADLHIAIRTLPDIDVYI